MNAHTLKVLEYRALLSHLGDCTQSQPARQLVEDLLPKTSEEQVVHELSLTSEALRLLEQGDLDLSDVRDSAVALNNLRAEGSVLQPGDLLVLLANQKAVGKARAALRDNGSGLASLEAIVRKMSSFKDWEEWINRSISEEGEVLDSASPELAKARRDLRKARETVVKRLEGYIIKGSVAKVLQENYVTLRNGRYVIPAKPEYHRVFEGIVQDSSQSGQTLFVEPLFAVDLNNAFIKMKGHEEEQVRKALSQMSSAARDIRDELLVNLELLALLDLVLAKARLGRKLEGVIPRLDEETTDIVEARHPLLALRADIKCIPIDLSVGGTIPTLVITGPNTGGKTVALKTIGLLTLMVQSGMPIPAGEGSRVRVFSQVFADIGDEQSIAQNLSTFSAHMSIISDILRRSNSSTLVLLDELGAGTDPQEGSALGVALLEVLHKKGGCTVVTTHHNLLKEFAYRAPYAGNASTIFDLETLEPTYRIRSGLPGRSYALEVAGRLGIDGTVLNIAQEVMGTGAVRVDELLGRLSEELDRETRARVQAEKVSSQLDAERERLRIRQEKAREEIRQSKEEARREASSFIMDLKRKGKALLKEVKKSKVSDHRKLADEIAGMETELDRQLPPTPRRRPNESPVRLGQKVEVLPLGIEGQVVNMFSGDREAEVQSKDVRLRVPVHELSALEEDMDEGLSLDRESPKVAYEGEADVPIEINLLGCSVEEALQSVDTVLDRSLLGPTRELRIVHGKGTGALRQAIMSALRNDSRVRRYQVAPLNEGGAGVTVVELIE
jgi:DNA mismatch repair protein MutS2